MTALPSAAQCRTELQQILEAEIQVCNKIIAYNNIDIIIVIH